MTQENILLTQISALIIDERNWLANFSNASALLMENLADINWAGFYFYDKKSDELILGPFQGKTACIRIKNGRGVCGTAFATEKVIRVADVHDFPGHIACDVASLSEIVVPLFKNGQIFGVLDIDAPIKDRFSETDEKIFAAFAKILTENIDLPNENNVY